MRRASSLFDIDQEPLFEPALLEAAADDELVWDGGLDEFPPTPEPAGDLEADEPGRRSLVPGGRARLLVAMATLGAVGLLGSRLTQDADPPSALPSAAPDPPAEVALPPAAQASPLVQQGHRARGRRANADRARRRERARRVQRVAHARQSEPLRRAIASPARSTAPVPTPATVTPPPAQGRAPERQGFTGEFF